MPKTQKERIYLSEDEKNILTGLLEEWNSKPNKKARDGFVSSEALPRIQALDLVKYGPDIISTDKGAKTKWEKRVQVRISTECYQGLANRTMEGNIHMVQKQQAIQRPCGFQIGKEDSLAASDREAEI